MTEPSKTPVITTTKGVPPITTIPTPAAASSLPKCVCNWKNCRNYQKCWRETRHSLFDGVVKLKFVAGQPESEALKHSIDVVLGVEYGQQQKNKQGSVVRYVIARHHFTPAHLKKMLQSSSPSSGQQQQSSSYTFLKPFSLHGAQKYLHTVDPQWTLDAYTNPKVLMADSPTDGAAQNYLYLQTPTVPKDVVKQEFTRCMEVLSWQQRHDRVVHDNVVLREQLDAMKAQLTFLHDMVQKLQEQQLAHVSAMAQQRSGTSVVSRGARSSRRPSHHHHHHHGQIVPREIQLPDDTDDCENDAYWNEPTDGDWTDNYQSTDEDCDDDDDDDDDELTTSTFHHHQHAHRRSMVGSAHNLDADDRTVATRQSIVSTSKSVKTLPREIELEEDDSDAESLEEEAFDNRSHANNSRRGSYKSFVSSLSRNNKAKNSSKHSRKFSGTTAHSSLSSGGPNNNSNNNANGSEHSSSQQQASYEVQAVIVTDPYGEKGSYTGSISRSTGMPNGYGRLEYDKPGRWYEGDWSHGRWTGHGQLSNGDGDYYQGGLKNDHKHGRGTMQFADGRTFEGEYRNGQMVQGKMTYQDGSTYSGSWVDGMRHGFGRCVFTDASVYEGEFREGEFYGHGKMTWNDGGWYEGEWMAGEMHGTGSEVRADGSLRHDGEWVKGQPIRSKK